MDICRTSRVSIGRHTPQHCSVLSRAVLPRPDRWHEMSYATQGEAITAAVEAVLATLPWSWAKSPLRDFQNAVPDESGQQGSDHGGAENDETEKLPGHGPVPAMPNFRVNPSSSMA